MNSLNMLTLEYIIPINIAANKGFSDIISVKKGRINRLSKKAIGVPLPAENVALPRRYLMDLLKSGILAYVGLYCVT